MQEITNRKNLLLLVTLRWVAVAGQIAAIAITSFWLEIRLPIWQMAAVIAFLITLNLVTLYRYGSGAVITNAELFVDLLLDVATLTMLLYLSGGATNPFVTLFLLQAVLGAVLLQPWSSWTIVAVTSGCFLWLTVAYHDIGFTMSEPAAAHSRLFDLHIYGMFLCFLLAAALLVLFITRINRNQREQDMRFAELRQQTAEEEHIVRMGLLASGAAHELGTPLATLSVILNDWERMPIFRADGEIATELSEMQGQLNRCKTIVSGILQSSGEARGENSERTSIVDFIDGVVEDWEDSRNPARLDYNNRIEPDFAIASDLLLQQVLFNVLDNALEASPGLVSIDVDTRDDLLLIAVRDAGPGFKTEMLAEFGKPYRSTKQRPGSGLGLFLVVNVLRKLGGQARAANRPAGGAVVELSLPIAALSVEVADGE
ncbi:HAMP domain-containing histidine kinase [Tardiphaga sp. vice352]|nr:HAMP domain-containing histidine kinase [Tardiphaga sp.]QDM19355.1 HAMP domain-containing histidine kinase [Tardiphaga sp. vice278]QDM24337.1 HAMP domain-containing histidine kinase [Tardiphaga sp. vice154]QDM29545.1 HAMP domain-containing histidine kinase [Tardiphaga sp. vice304]QDM34651.1 HAMP domain-containing histidine kinase [Tardiphaga sp. vice352]